MYHSIIKHGFNALSFTLTLGMVALLGVVAHADTLHLNNGDTVSGHVTSVDAKMVKLASENFGEITVPREKIRSIYFGDAKPVQAAVAAAPQATNTGQADKGYNIPQLPAIVDAQKQYGADTGGSVDDAVKQLQGGAVDPKMIKEITSKLPGFASPEVQEYFNNTLGGLASGKLDVQSVRKDAIYARDQILDLKKDLGPDAAALDGYLGILENFIDKSAPRSEKKAEKNAAENSKQQDRSTKSR